LTATFKTPDLAVVEVLMIDLRDVRAVISDIDGVLWRGETPLPGVAEFFGDLRRRSIPFVLATNNATTTCEQIAGRLKGIGFVPRKQEVLTSAHAAASFLQREMPSGSSVLVVGEDALSSALERAGFRLVRHASEAAAVVAALDRHVTWEKLTEATVAIRNGAMFVATNLDPTFPSERGLLPGAGALIALLETATSCHPLLIGKPEPLLYLEALKTLKASAQETLVLGDRIETDIIGGQRAGMPTALLLTGVTTREVLAASPHKPDWVFENLLDVRRAMLG
jgi:HAD superfamily hydrolase (TIGR01457 family)